MADYGVRFSPGPIAAPEENEEGLLELNAFGPANLGSFRQGLDDPTRSAFAPVTSVEGAREWFTGRNLNGEVNGWNTTFMQQMQDQYNTALEKAGQEKDGRIVYDRFNEADATGVVTWNDTNTGRTAGDVYFGGKKQGNLYEMYKDDPGTADLLMTQIFQLYGYEQARLNEDAADGGDARRRTIAAMIEDSTEKYNGTRTAAEYQDRVGTVEESIDGTTSVLGATLAGAGGGASTGAAGFLGGPILGAITTVGGAIAGGVAGFLNRDQITEMTARNIVQVQDAADPSKGGDTLAGFFAGVEGFGEVGLQSANVLNNSVNGIYDALEGDPGDNTAEAYATDVWGQPKMSGGWQALQVASTFADSALQFMSVPGRVLYFVNTGSVTAGKAGNVFVKDQVFNERTGTWDELEGPREELAAAGSVTIDAVQMGMAGGLLARTKSLQQAAGLRPQSSDTLAARAWGALPGRNRAEIKVDSASDVMNGMRVFRDADGAVTTMRPSIQLFAPSEFTKYISTQFLARRRAMSDGGRAVTADDFAFAAARLQSSASKFSNAVLTGFAEGAEEAAQGVLDPVSTSSQIVLEDVYKASLYGFASGAGMALGAQMHGQRGRGLSQKQMETLGRARANMERRFGAEVGSWSDEQFLMHTMLMDPADLERWAAPQDEQEAREQGEAIRAAQKMMEFTDILNNPVGFSLLQSIVDTAEKQGATKTSNGTGALTLLPRVADAVHDPLGNFIEFEGGPDFGSVSVTRLLDTLRLKVQAFQEHKDGREVRIADLRNMLAIATEAGDQRRIDRINELITATEQDQQGENDLIAAAEAIYGEAQQIYEVLKSTDVTDRRSRRGLVHQLNRLMQEGANAGVWRDVNGVPLELKPEDVTRVTEALFSRQPWMDPGATVRIVLQADLDLEEVADHGSIHLDQTLYKTMNADLDGDQLQQQVTLFLNREYVPPNERAFYRQGRQMLGQVSERKDIDWVDFDRDAMPTPSVYKPTIDTPDSELATIGYLASRLRSGSADATIITQEIEGFLDWARARYDGILPRRELNKVLRTFETELVAGNGDARDNMLVGLSNIDVAAFLDRGIGEGAEVAILSRAVTNMLERAQRKMAVLSGVTPEMPSAPNEQSVREATVHLHSTVRAEAATLGGTIRQVLGGDRSGVRSAQKLNYLEIIKAALQERTLETGENRAGLVAPGLVESFGRLYMLFNSSTSETKSEQLDSIDRIGQRVLDLLEGMVKEIELETGTQFTKPQRQNMMLMLSNIAIPDFDTDAQNNPTNYNGRDITVLQMLLRRSIQFEEQNVNAEQLDSARRERLSAMKAMTRNGGDKSYTWAQAIMEVFGPSQIGDILGDLHAEMGPNATVNQLRAQLESRTQQSRRNWLHIRRNNGVGYLKHKNLGDPPYSFNGDNTSQGYIDFLSSGQINGYTVLIDALAAVSNNNLGVMKDRNKNFESDVQQLFRQMRQIISEWQRIHEKRLIETYGESSVENAVKDLMENDPTFVSLAAEFFTPESRESTFAIDRDSRKIIAREWAWQLFTVDNPARATKMLHLFTELDKLIQLGRNESRKKAKALDSEVEQAEAIVQAAPDLLRDASEAVRGLRYSQIKSRLGQTLYIALNKMPEDGGLLFLELQRAMFQTDTNDEMYALINESPALRRDREELMAWFNDVADFELSPEALFNADRAGAAQRESLSNMMNRMNMLSTQLQERTVDEQVRVETTSLIRSEILNPSSNPRAQDALTLYRIAIERAKSTPDVTGPNAYDQALDAAIHGFIVQHEKSKAPKEYAALGATIFDALIAGRHNDLYDEVHNIGTYEWDDIAANPKILLRGPVRIARPEGGATIVVDWSDELNLLDALANNTLAPLAMAALFPRVRDVTSSGGAMIYSLVLDDSQPGERRSPYAFDKALEEIRFLQLFPADGPLSYDKALKTLGLIEGYMVQDAVKDGPQAQRDASLVITHLLHDTLVAYMNSPAAQGKSPDKIKQDVVRKTIVALQKVAAYVGTNDTLRQSVLDVVQAEMRTRVGREYTAEELQQFIDPDLTNEQKQKRIMRAQLVFDWLTENFEEALLDPNVTQKEREALTARHTKYTEMLQEGVLLEYLERNRSSQTYVPFGSLQEYYTVDTSSAEAHTESIKRILTFMQAGARMSLFNRARRGPEALELWRKISDQLDDNFDVQSIPATDWNALGTFAAQIAYQDLYSPKGAQVGFLAANPKIAEELAYLDASYSYLPAQLFNPKLVLAMQVLGKHAGLEELAPRTQKELVNHLTQGIYSQDVLGDWDDVIASDSIILRQALGGTPVNEALTTAGSTPGEVRSDVIADLNAYGAEVVMDETHLSVYVMPLRRDAQSVDAQLNQNPLMYASLEHHYVTEVIITGAGLPPDGVPITNRATVMGSTDPAVVESDFRLLTTQQLQKAVEQFYNNPAYQGVDKIDVKITYVDVLKKPAEDAYANSAWFDGEGRNPETGTGMSPIAAAFLSVSGINKLTQQFPLDFATNNAESFYAYVPQTHEEVTRTLSKAHNLTELILWKAMHLLRQQYSFGELQRGDLNALVRLMKFRHVVEMPDGTFLWAEQAMALEQDALRNNKPLPQFKQIIPLSDSQAEKLLQNPTDTYTQGQLSAPLLLAADGNTRYPPLNQETLERLGLYELGQTATLINSPAASFLLGPAAYHNAEMSETRARPGQVTIVRIDDQARQAAHLKRSGLSESQRPSKLNSSRKKLRRNAVQIEAVFPAIAGTPRIMRRESDTLNTIRAKYAEMVEHELFDENLSVMWLINGSNPTVSGMNSAVLSEKDLQDNFTGDSPYGNVVAGDVLTFDLSALLQNYADRHDGVVNRTHVFEFVTGVISKLQRSGSNIDLIASSGPASELRQEIAQWILLNMPYRRVAGSTHFFTPVTAETNPGANDRFARDSLTRFDAATGENVKIIAVSPYEARLSENGGFIVPKYMDDLRQREYVPLGHFSLTYTDAGLDRSGNGGTSFSFGPPIADGTDTSTWARTREHMRRILDEPSAFERVLEMFKDENGNTDPKGAVFLREHADGSMTPGIRSARDALRLLHESLSNSDPLVGRELAVGDMYLTIDNRGHAVILRWGFKPPEGITLNDRFADGELQDEFEKLTGTLGTFRLAAATSQKIETEQSVPPPFRITAVLRDNRVEGVSRLAINGKWTLQGLGMKIGTTLVPADLTPIESRLGNVDSNDIGIALHIPMKSFLSKGGFVADNVRDMAAIVGVDFQRVLIDYFATLYDVGKMDRDQQWKLIRAALQSWQNQESTLEERDLRILWDTNRYFDAVGIEMTEGLGQFIPGVNIDAIRNAAFGQSAQTDPKEHIALMTLSVLQLPGVQLEHLLGSTGFINLPSMNGPHKTHWMPSIFTEELANPLFPETTVYVRKLMNGNLRLGPNGEIVQRINPDWSFEYLVYDSSLPPTQGNQYPQKRWNRVYLAASVPEQANENPLVAQNQQVVRPTTQITPYMRRQADVLMQGGYPHDPRRRRDGGEIEVSPIQEFINGIDLANREEQMSFFSLMPRIRMVDDSFNSLAGTTYMAQKEQDRADARGRLYSIALDKSTKTVEREDGTTKQTWTNKTKRKEIERLIIQRLNMEHRSEAANEMFLDLMVRLWAGKPGPSEDQKEGEFTDISEELYIEALTAIRKNVDKYRLPTINGEVPLIHAQLGLRVIFDAQEGKANPWAPAADGRGRTVGNRWDDWVLAAMGQVKNSKFDFQYMYTSDFFGMWRTYQGVSVHTDNMAMTPNQMVQAQLMSPNTQEAAAHYAKWVKLKEAAELATTDAARADIEAKIAENELTFRQVKQVLSPDKGDAAMIGEVILREDQLNDLDQLLGKHNILLPSNTVENSWTAVDKKRKAGWRAKKGIDKQDYTPMTNYLSDGKKFIGETTFVNGIGRNLNNISLINRILNPAIFFSAFLEMPLRSGLQNLADLVVGDALGPGGRLAAKFGESWLGQTLGVSPAYSVEDYDMMDALAQYLGKHPTWREEMVEQLNYQVLVATSDNATSWSKKIERLAGRVTPLMTDPRIGISGTYLAKLYLTGVLEYLNMTSGNVINIKQFAAQVQRDPMFFAKNTPNDFGPHIQGLNRLAQTRAMKPTMLSSAIMRPLAAAQRSENGFLNFGGALAHLPFMFTTFNLNALTTFTGLTGWDQTAAMMLDSRFKRIFVKNANDRMDFTDVIESIDLQKTFIRDGISQTMLFTLGMMAGNLGLGGEDEEEKRRRKLAYYLNVDLLGDPLKPENDFRFADAIFLDKIPLLGTIFRNDAGNSAVVPHWTLKQFTSPIMGMQRFFTTGDFREVYLGFYDAFAAMPTSVIQLWNHAENTSLQLLKEARAEAEDKGEYTEEAQNALWSAAITAVGILERALLENAAINAAIQAQDEFDRNPYLLPRTDNAAADGLDRTQGQNLPQKTTARVATRVGEGEDSEVITPYMTRTGIDAEAHNYAKSNVVFGYLASLFTGQGLNGSFQRKNMVPREVTVRRPDRPMEEVEALVYASYFAQGGADELRLNESDIYQLLKRRALIEEGEWDQVELESQAAALYSANSGATRLTSLLADGREALTKYGNEAVIKGIWSGQVELGSPALRGWAITEEQRDELRVSLMTKVKQDAINLGLSNESANYVMRRVWYGDEQTGAVGMRDIIYSDQIPLNSDLKYRQLNVMFKIGPDGTPWATPFSRNNIFAAFGVPSVYTIKEPPNGFKLDALGNTIDTVTGINTGLAGLAPTPVPEIELEPKDVKDIEKANFKKDTDPYYTRKRFGSGGGSGGGYFNRMDRPPYSSATRFDDTPFINTSSPYIRRSRVNRERVFTDRGRLNQWQ